MRIIKTWALAIVLLVIYGHSSAKAQETERIVIVPLGREQVVSFKGMSGAGVGDVNVTYILRRTLDEVVLFGAGTGETMLTIFERGGRVKKMLVRVLQTPPPAAREPSLIETAIWSQLNPVPSGGSAVTVQPRQVPPPVLAGAASSSQRQPSQPAVNDARAPRRARAQARSLLSRLEISAETLLLSDREDVQLVSYELANPSKLREAVSAPAGDRLAANSQRQQIMTVRRYSVITPLTVRFDIDPRNSLTAVVPYVRRRDEIKVGTSSVVTRGQGLGDVQVKFERSYARLRNSAWDGTLEFSAGLPTGRSIYNAGANQSPTGLGHYEVGGVVGAQRVFDPMVLSAALGLSYTVPRTVQGTRVAPGLGYSAQTGFGYAVNDRLVFSEQLDYTRRPNVFLLSPTDAGTAAVSQSYLSHSLIYNAGRGHALRMMFNLGLTPASSDYGFGFTYTYRRKDPSTPMERR
jgi:hypothetical protein